MSVSSSQVSASELAPLNQRQRQRQTKELKGQTLSLVVVGDLAFHGHYHRSLGGIHAESPLATVARAWQSADLRLGNLESPLTDQPRVSSSKLTLRGTELAGKVLRQAGIDVVSLANNHVMDFGPSGIANTQRCLQSQEVGFLGAGQNGQEATRPLLLEIRGQRVGILAWCDVEQASPLYATDEAPGAAKWGPEEAHAAIAKLRPQVDWLLVHLHWGQEFAELPSLKQRDTARSLADAGVDVIVGHHPHVLQPAEVIDRTAVLYSLGNFTFSPLRWRGTNAQGESFTARKRMPDLSSHTAWIEVELCAGSSPRVVFHPARLRRDLSVVPDDRPQRYEHWDGLRRQLESENYGELCEAEFHRAAERNAWTGEWRSLLGRLELKLYEHGLLSGAKELG